MLLLLLLLYISRDLPSQSMLTFLVGVGAAMSSLLLPSSALPPLQRGARASTPIMQRRETLRFRLTDCLANGVGVGLDPQNVVDFLRPGGGASQNLLMGDLIMQWNGKPLIDPVTKEQIQLASVVDGSLDEHIVAVERLLTPLSKDAEDALTSEAMRRVSSLTSPEDAAPSPTVVSAAVHIERPASTWNGEDRSATKPPSW